MEEPVVTTVQQNGVSIDLPAPQGWDAAEGLMGTAVACFAPVVEPGEFRANINVLVQVEPAPLDMATLERSHSATLTGGLDEPRVLDLELTHVDERPASRALATYAQDGDDLTLEQWIVPVGDRSVVISFTSRSNDFAALREAVTESVEAIAIDA